MEIKEDKRKQVVGELLTREKYKFLPHGLVGEIIREAFDELEKL